MDICVYLMCVHMCVFILHVSVCGYLCVLIMCVFMRIGVGVWHRCAHLPRLLQKAIVLVGSGLLV